MLELEKLEKELDKRLEQDLEGKMEELESDAMNKLPPCSDKEKIVVIDPWYVMKKIPSLGIEFRLGIRVHCHTHIKPTPAIHQTKKDAIENAKREKKALRILANKPEIRKMIEANREIEMKLMKEEGNLNELNKAIAGIDKESEENKTI